MKQKYFSILLAILTTFAICLGAAYQAIGSDRVYLDISTSATRKINIAVPWFETAGSSQTNNLLARDLADTLAKALKFHGIISIIPTEQYGGMQHADWKDKGADYVVLGRYKKENDSIALEMRLLDVAENKIIMGKSFSGSVNQKDRMQFKYCDSVVETLTGIPGVADTRIAFINHQDSAKEVYLTDILGRNVRQITRHKHLTVSPRFVPDSYNLTYSSYHTGNQNLYITDLRQDKTTRALSRRKGLNLAPAWFKNGSKMILTLSKRGNPDLYLLDDKGQIIEQLTDRAGINVSPTLSPDGNHLVFVSDRSGRPQLYHMDMRTRKVQRITFEGSENAEPDWSPTDNLVVYSSLRDGVYQLCVVNPLQPDTVMQITNDLSHHESPNWSPDGNQIIFAKRDGKRHQIYGIMKNGSFQRRLFTMPGSQSYPQWAR
ncbi:PD40 domain-containing protein [Desulforhopalus singaporensis]|uniref:TolB protein n=1 Tax=Desulforhopalus singaporensis TaxID=91360 RepID=A0A1H0PVN4_9BACT|nr:PD40 domain-containing protein [Desulforhopalus singaporensis]SDP09217.1 TolB protein [Desulforhopalus singaporensis]